jgi:hypothetical protein
MILKLHSKPASVGGKRAAEASSHASEAGFGSTAVRPKAALRGAGGAGAEAAPPRGEGRSTTSGRNTAASEQTRRMACHRAATDSHAEKSGRGAGGAGLRPQHRSEQADVRDVERAARLGERIA